MAKLNSDDWEPCLFTNTNLFQTSRGVRKSVKAGADFLRLWAHVQPTPSWLIPPPLPPLSEATANRLTQLFELASSVVLAVRSPVSSKKESK